MNSSPQLEYSPSGVRSRWYRGETASPSSHVEANLGAVGTADRRRFLRQPVQWLAEQISSRAPGTGFSLLFHARPRASPLIISRGLSISLPPQLDHLPSPFSSSSCRFSRRVFRTPRRPTKRRTRANHRLYSLSSSSRRQDVLPPFPSRIKHVKIPSTPASAESNCLYAGGNSRRGTIGPPDRSEKR